MDKTQGNDLLTVNISFPTNSWGVVRIVTSVLDLLSHNYNDREKILKIHKKRYILIALSSQSELLTSERSENENYGVKIGTAMLGLYH